jgi:hypothetical protein
VEMKCDFRDLLPWNWHKYGWSSVWPDFCVSLCSCTVDTAEAMMMMMMDRLKCVIANCFTSAAVVSHYRSLQIAVFSLISWVCEWGQPTLRKVWQVSVWAVRVLRAARGCWEGGLV